VAHQIEIRPDKLTLVNYTAEDVATVVAEEAARVGVPESVAISVEVDEVLPSPLTGSTADVVDGDARLWLSGGELEDPRYRLELADAQARQVVAMSLHRIVDRLGPCAEAPSDMEIGSGRRRAAWDVWAEGRTSRLGVPVHPSRRRYHFRIAHGFNDVADAVFDRLWAADELIWADLLAACAQTEAVDAREPPKKAAGLRR
jgi:hypothetical protein